MMRRPRDEISREHRIIQYFHNQKDPKSYHELTEELLVHGDGCEEELGPLWDPTWEDGARRRQAYNEVRRALRQPGPRQLPIALMKPPEGIGPGSPLEDILGVDTDSLPLIPEEMADASVHYFNAAHDLQRAVNDIINSPLRHWRMCVDTYNMDMAPMLAEIVRKEFRRIGYDVVPLLESGAQRSIDESTRPTTH